MHVDQSYISKHIGNRTSYQHEDYCENMLSSAFGSTSVSSIDNSDYEGATIVKNLNNPIADEYIGSFDTIIDGGFSKHIFNIPTVLLNIARMSKVGGQIIHALPANNFCGHGFWQFSPELFFSLYNTKNGDRVNFYSSNPAYVLVRTLTTRVISDFQNIQQSDYIKSWKDGQLVSNSKPSSFYLNEISLDFLSSI